MASVSLRVAVLLLPTERTGVSGAGVAVSVSESAQQTSLQFSGVFLAICHSPSRHGSLSVSVAETKAQLAAQALVDRSVAVRMPPSF